MADARTVQLAFPEPDIAVITFDAPDKGANILSRGVLDELERHARRLLARKDLAGLIFRSAKPGIFIAGADIREFAASEGITHDEVVAFATRGRELFARLSKAAVGQRGGDRRRVRGRRRGTGHVVRPAADVRQPQGAVRLSGSEAGHVSRLGRHGPHAADGGPEQRRGNGHQRRIDRRPRRRADGPGQRRAPSARMLTKPPTSWFAR